MKVVKPRGRRAQDSAWHRESMKWAVAWPWVGVRGVEPKESAEVDGTELCEYM